MKEKFKNFIWNDLLLRPSTLFRIILGILYFLFLFSWLQEQKWNFNVYIEPLTTTALALLFVAFSTIIALIDAITKALKLNLKFKCLNNKIIKPIALFFCGFYFIFTLASFCWVFLSILILMYYFILDNLG